MKFGETLTASRIPGWETHYINYERLKIFVTAGIIEEAKGNDILFANAMLSEEKRIGFFLSGKISEVIDKLEHLLQASTPAESEASGALATAVSEEIQRLGEFVRVNNEGVRKILKKYCKVLGRTTTWHSSDTWLARSALTIDQLIIALSQYYAKHFSTASEWVPPASFERRTTKYWVHMEDVLKIKLFVIQHLPILEIHKTPFPTRGLDHPPPSQVHNYISSVYLDNDAFECYHERMEKLEGAELMRIRWYGGVSHTADGLPSPNPAECLFLERKMHHESWVEEKSTKLRVPINQALLSAFMDGSLPPQSAVEFMTHQGAIKKKDFQSALDVATDYQTSVLTRKLHPVIRTTYHRTAFQLSDSNDVRISLDAPMFIGTEDFTQSYARLGASTGSTEAFPFGVLEIKLTGENSPAWVDELLARIQCTPVRKFSKYQQGVADHYPERIRVLPYWIDDLPKDRPGSKLCALAAEAKGSKAPISSQSSAASVASADSGNTSAAATEAGRAATAQPQVVWSIARTEGATGPSDHTVMQETSLSDGPIVTRVATPISTAASTLKSHHQVDGAQPSPAPGDLGTRGGLLAGLRRRFGKKDSSALPPKADQPPEPTKPAQQSILPKKVTAVPKIEPKTYFANERTFIQWISAGVLIFSLSVALMTISATSRTVGLVMFPVSILFFAYALWLYNWRLHKINSRDRSNYADPYGPWIFAIALSVTAAVALAVIWTSASQAPVIPPHYLFCRDAAPVCLSSSVAAAIQANASTLRLSSIDFTFVASVRNFNPNQTLGALNCSLASSPPASTPNTVEWEQTFQYLCPASTPTLSSSPSGLPVCSLPSNVPLASGSMAVRYFTELSTVELLVESDSFDSIYALARQLGGATVSLSMSVFVACPAPFFQLRAAAPLGVAAPTSSTQLNALFGNISLFAPGASLAIVTSAFNSHLSYRMRIASNAVTLAIQPHYASEHDRALLAQPASVTLSLVLNASAVTGPSQTALQQSAKLLVSAAVAADYVVVQLNETAIIVAVVLSVFGFVLLIPLAVVYATGFSFSNMRKRPALTLAPQKKAMVMPEKPQASYDKVASVPIQPAGEKRPGWLAWPRFVGRRRDAYSPSECTIAV